MPCTRDGEKMRHGFLYDVDSGGEQNPETSRAEARKTDGTGSGDRRKEKEENRMKIYFTITGTNHRYGSSFMKEGMKVFLEKEPDNKYDREAIKVMMEGLGQVGYVANSTYTVLGESYSAGRLYDKIGDTARGKVLLVMDKGVICVLKKDKHPAPEDGMKYEEAKEEADVLPE